MIGYATYVVIGRVCIPFIEDSGTRAKGVGLMVGYLILLLVMLWSYMVVVITPPGKATDHVSSAPRPTPRYVPPSQSTADEFHASEPYRPPTSSDETARDPIPVSNPTLLQAPDDALLKPEQNIPPQHTPDQRAPNSNPGQQSTAGHPQETMQRSLRRPPSTPVLLPEYRYCQRDNIVKPHRTHHCRACGTCILKYDHHCPWIGQCVGARNHRFFVIFNLWGAIFTAYLLGMMIGTTAARGSEDIDPQCIVIIALAGIFFIFTFSLYYTHCRLTMLNQTTVESLAFRDMREKEQMTDGCLFWDRSQKHLSNEEWGRIGREGNIWWKDGGWRPNFEETMGTSVIGWFLPIGRPDPRIGLEYTPNRRFDLEGRWMQRKQWPTDLR
ncbi:DHHC palmitoyltransferase-domain-containing protein [Pterulicium gracile]|uniref:Palmitoyltransferase n=1 Tax=Pterulicium gracile TaxID=1884261 RepID=A0A5C3QNG3_9AGAR|nr:DHHC palmitoyltransferase-domain-containing protein [Pterula gracilis]